jgi:hypothetical protein
VHTVKDAKIFVESLNEDQRRALADGLMLPARASATLIATRLCEAILLARAVHHISHWRNQ